METEERSPSRSPVEEKPKRAYRRKQTAEDKRKRNYIAVRKHRQQLKDTLEQSPHQLVQLKKTSENLDIDIFEGLKVIDRCKEMVKRVESRKGFCAEDLETISMSKGGQKPTSVFGSSSTSSTTPTSSRDGRLSDSFSDRSLETFKRNLPMLSSPPKPIHIQFPQQSNQETLPFVMQDQMSLANPFQNYLTPQVPTMPLMQNLFPMMQNMNSFGMLQPMGMQNYMNFGLNFGTTQFSQPISQQLQMAQMYQQLPQSLPLVPYSQPLEMTQEYIQQLWNFHNLNLNS